MDIQNTRQAITLTPSLTPTALARVEKASAWARRHIWACSRRCRRRRSPALMVVLDVDATLVTVHSEKEARQPITATPHLKKHQAMQIKINRDANQKAS
jgi:hypothetical protein